MNHPQEVPLSTLVGLAPTHPDSESEEVRVIDLAKTISLIFVGNAYFRSEDYLYKGKRGRKSSDFSLSCPKPKPSILIYTLGHPLSRDSLFSFLLEVPVPNWVAQ